MPYTMSQSLTHDENYAITAYMLSLRACCVHMGSRNPL